MANIDVAKSLATVRTQVPALKYPIANAQSLLAQLQGKTFTGPLKGKTISASSAVKHISAKSFPIASDADFDNKVSSLISHHATKKGFTPINIPPKKA
jgi:hypothetical protein